MSLALTDWLLATNSSTPSGLKFYHFGRWVASAEPTGEELASAYRALAREITLDDLVFVTQLLLRSMRMEYLERFLSWNFEDEFPLISTEDSFLLAAEIKAFFEGKNIALINQELRWTMDDLVTA